MRDRFNTSLLIALLATPALLFAVGCNDDIDDPAQSENQIAIASVNPADCCVDVDGDGTAIWDVVQSFTFQSRVRGDIDPTSKWSDVNFNRVDLTYRFTDGNPDPELASRSNVPCNILVKAGSTGTGSLTTFPAAYIIDYGLVAGRQGEIGLTFRGRDAAGNAAAPVSTTVRFGTYTACGE